jgi:hypothetical protein
MGRPGGCLGLRWAVVDPTGRLLGQVMPASHQPRSLSTSRRLPPLKAAVWHEVQGLLEHPHHRERAYRRRLAPPAKLEQGDDPAMLQAQLGKLRHGIAWLIDSYAEGPLEKSDFEPRITRLKRWLLPALN